MPTGILKKKIADTPVAVIDFETTGMTPGFDRVVEVAVVRIEPGARPRLVLDTLINPGRPMGASWVHGITDADVSGAPRFGDVAGELLAATKDSVIAAYNVYFDMGFLDFELSNSGVGHAPPHVCLMYMRPMLGLGARCRLDEACGRSGIEHGGAHIASTDAMAAARLFEIYLEEMARRGVSTYGELAALRRYKFTQSFSRSPFPGPSAFGLKRSGALLSRAAGKGAGPARRAVLTAQGASSWTPG